MEKLYRFLKILIAILAVAVILVGMFVLYNHSKTETPMESATLAPESSAEAASNQAWDFTFYDIDGNAYNLSDFQGKPVILNFWASWCGPCKSEMPDLEGAYKAYGEQIHFLIINLTDGERETVDTASAYIAGQGYTFPVYYDTQWDGATTYSISAIPMTYFIDAEGNFVYQVKGMMSSEVLQDGIDKLLN